jgi:hypothetical protein
VAVKNKQRFVAEFLHNADAILNNIGGTANFMQAHELSPNGYSAVPPRDAMFNNIRKASSPTSCAVVHS